jgi:regulator of sirC expression with transglutaminase-like and TPR domain
MSKPGYSRPNAYRLFRAQMPRIETLDGLLMAAIAVSMHEMSDVRPDQVDERISAYARQVRSRVRGDSQQALLAHLHDVLFDEEGFIGNSDNYYQPYNSYLPAVLDSRRGLPITLALVYKGVAERAGLKVAGINAPLHFLAGVEMGNDVMLVDPFFSGRVLSKDEAFERIEQAAGRTVARVDQMLPKATHRQWIIRVLQNLMNIFQHEGREEDYRAMVELRGVAMTEG